MEEWLIYNLLVGEALIVYLQLLILNISISDLEEVACRVANKTSLSTLKKNIISLFLDPPL